MRTSICAKRPSLVPGPAPRRSRGFTLIELMVVIFIIGLAASMVVLTLPGDNSTLNQDADRFALRVAAARNQAILGSRPVSVWVSASGYGFDRRSEGQWVPIGESAFDTTDWTRGTRAEVPGSETGQERIVFDATGLPSEPMAVTLTRGEISGTVRVGPTGEVTLDGQ